MLKPLNLNKQDLEKYQDSLNNLVSLKQEMNKRRDIFLKETEELTNKINYLTEGLNDEKTQFSELAIKGFAHDGNKKLIGGLGIRIGTIFNYVPETAFEWAKKHSLCLALDKRQFDSLAKIQDMDFVEKEELVTVTFPKEIRFDEVD